MKKLKEYLTKLEIKESKINESPLFTSSSNLNRLIWDDCTPTANRRPTTPQDIDEDIHIEDFNSAEDLYNYLLDLIGIDELDDYTDPEAPINEQVRDIIGSFDDPGDGSINFIYAILDGEEVWPCWYDSLEDLDLANVTEEEVKDVLKAELEAEFEDVLNGLLHDHEEPQYDDEEEFEDDDEEEFEEDEDDYGEVIVHANNNNAPAQPNINNNGNRNNLNSALQIVSNQRHVTLTVSNHYYLFVDGLNIGQFSNEEIQGIENRMTVEEISQMLGDILDEYERRTGNNHQQNQNINHEEDEEIEDEHQDEDDDDDNDFDESLNEGLFSPSQYDPNEDFVGTDEEYQRLNNLILKQNSFGDKGIPFYIEDVEVEVEDTTITIDEYELFYDGDRIYSDPLLYDLGEFLNVSINALKDTIDNEDYDDEKFCEFLENKYHEYFEDEAREDNDAVSKAWEEYLDWVRYGDY